MKLLVPLPFDVGNLEQGRNLRVVNLLKRIATHFDLTVLTPDTDRAASLRGHLSAVEVRIARQPADAAITNGARARSRTQRCLDFYDAAPHLAAETSRIAPEFDAILGFDLASLPALHRARRLNGARPPIVCDLIDDPWLTWQSMPFGQRFRLSNVKAAIAIQHLRRAVLRQADVILTAGTRDAASLRKMRLRHVEVLANGVDLEPLPQIETAREPLAVFTGYMSFPPNEAAALHLVHRIWPRVQEQLARRGVQGFRLALVGADPSPKLQQAAEHAGALVTGHVPSVREWLGRARVSVAPMLSGCGIKNKILEACACGCPVVTTTRGATGIPTGPARGISTADSVGQFARLMVDLLTSPEKAAAFGHAGYQMVGRHFTWNAAARQLAEAIELTAHQQSESADRRTRLNTCSPAPLRQQETLVDAAS